MTGKARREQRCCYCLRTDTERQPANPAVGLGAEECVDVAACSRAYQQRVQGSAEQQGWR